MSLDQTNALVSEGSVVSEPATHSAEREKDADRFEGMLDLDATESDESQATPASEETEAATGEEDTETTTDTEELDPWAGYEDYEVDGKVHKIPSELKEGFLLKADHTRRLQELAETRKQVETREVELNQRYERSEEEFKAHVALQNISSALEEFKDFNWNAEAAKVADDPMAKMELHDKFMRYQQLEQARQGLTNFTHNAANERIASVQQDTVKRLAATQDFAQKNIKGWTPALDVEITQWAVNVAGIPAKDLQNAVNPQIYKILHSAYQWDKSIERQQTAKPKVAETPPAPTKTVSAKASPQVTKSLEETSMDEYVKLRNAGKV